MHSTSRYRHGIDHGTCPDYSHVASVALERTRLARLEPRAAGARASAAASRRLLCPWRHVELGGEARALGRREPAPRVLAWHRRHAACSAP